MVTTIVDDPTANDRVEHPSQIVDAFVDTTVEPPVSHRLADGFCSLIAHARTGGDTGVPGS